MQGFKDEFLQKPVIGVYPISIGSITEAKDGGACIYKIKQIATGYLDGNGKDSGYFVPGGRYLSFESFSGGHQLFVTMFELKKGLTYTLSCYLRTNANKNPWKNGVGTTSSSVAMFRIFAKKLVNKMLQVSSDIALDLKIDDHTPSLQKYTSKPYTPEKDELVSVIIHPWLYDRNGYLWDVFYPQIQWRA